jgi:4-alpha-glucanotransferase
VTDAWSITAGYRDMAERWHATPQPVRDALRAAMGGEGVDAPEPPPPMRFVGVGEGGALERVSDVVLEDGTVLGALSSLPPDLPAGYHDVHPVDGGEPIRVVVTPRRCPLPLRQWGWAVQLYAVRSAASWGMGDLADLRALAHWSSRLGARVILTNPLHATAPVVPQEPSPYFASSRLWRNICYLRVSELPGAAALGADLAGLDDAGRRLNDAPRIDRDAVFRLKQEALGRLHAWFEAAATGHDAFDVFVRRHGEDLRRFAVYCVIAERHGADYRTWPSELRHPASPAVATFERTEHARVRFHQWCQWHLLVQLTMAAAAGAPLVSDLAVGFDVAGADAWAYQDLLAQGCRVGAPPDTFNPSGQDWGLPPFVPWKLRAARYSPFIATLRAVLAGGGGVRIDHVMGLFRLYWIARGLDPVHGAYVRYPASDLLDLVALEAQRADAFVVGEDLGTVEDEVRAVLAERQVLPYRVLWFEDEPPTAYPRRAAASVTTHDLPTIAGVWSGADVAARRRAGIPTDGSDDALFRKRLRDVTGLGDDAPVEDVIVETHRALGRAPSLVLLASLDDAVAAPDRPNLPGTIDEWPNWRLPLPTTLEALERHRLARSVAAALDSAVARDDA